MTHGSMNGAKKRLCGVCLRNEKCLAKEMRVANQDANRAETDFGTNDDSSMTHVEAGDSLTELRNLLWYINDYYDITITELLLLLSFGLYYYILTYLLLHFAMHQRTMT